MRRNINSDTPTGHARGAPRSAIAALVLTSVLAACGGAATSSGDDQSDAGGESDGGEASASDEARTITVGELAILTGIKAEPYGIPFHDGAEMAFADIEESGYLADTGITFELKAEDVATDVNAGVTQFNKFTQDGVDIFFGAADTPMTDAIRPLAAQTKSLYLTGAGGKPEEGSFVFSLVDSITPMVRFGEQLATNGSQRVVSIVDGDNDTFGIFADAFKNGLESKGGAVVQTSTISMNDTDFSSVLTKLAKERPDAVYLSTLSETAGNIMRQMQTQGAFKDVVTAGSVAWQDPVYGTGGDAAVGALFPRMWTAGLAGAETFDRAYESKYGEAPATYSAIGYHTAWLLAVATKLVHEDGDEVTGETLQAMIPEAASSPDMREHGLIADFTMRADGVAEYPGIFATFADDGTITAIDEATFAKLAKG